MVLSNQGISLLRSLFSTRIHGNRDRKSRAFPSPGSASFFAPAEALAPGLGGCHPHGLSSNHKKKETHVVGGFLSVFFFFFFFSPFFCGFLLCFFAATIPKSTSKNRSPPIFQTPIGLHAEAIIRRPTSTGTWGC